MPASELALLLRHSDAGGRDSIHAAAVAAGLMWQCRSATCPTHNLREAGLCTGCGRDRAGRPLSDAIPGLYSAPLELREQLRTEVAGHLRDAHVAPQPDAVTFTWDTEDEDAPWSLTDLVLHYGGRCVTHRTELAGTELADLLEEITLAVEPGHGQDLRIALPR